jgi:hypothetical protein
LARPGRKTTSAPSAVFGDARRVRPCGNHKLTRTQPATAGLSSVEAKHDRQLRAAFRGSGWSASGRTFATASACCVPARASRQSRCCRWQSASAPTARSSASRRAALPAASGRASGRCLHGRLELVARGAQRELAGLLVSRLRRQSAIAAQSFDGLAAFTYVTAGFAADAKASPKLKMGMLASGNLMPLMERRADDRTILQAR